MEVFYLEDKIEQVIEEIRPRLQADGGDIEFVGVDEGIVKVRLQGACAHCAMSQMTIQMGVERILKQKVPEVEKVVAV
jgi:Fe-S cluster biogenesis protein NfuA